MAFGILVYSSYSRFLLFYYYVQYVLITWPGKTKATLLRAMDVRSGSGGWDTTPLGLTAIKTCEGHGYALCLKIFEMKVHVCSPRVLSQALSFTSQSPKCCKNSRWNWLIWMFSRQMRWWNWMEGSTRHFKVEEESKYGIQYMYKRYVFVLVTLWVELKNLEKI